MSRANILCLDLGTKTGFAMRADGVTSCGTESFAPKRGDGEGLRYLKFSRWLNRMANGRAIGAVYFEDVRRHVGTDAAHCYGGLRAILTAWCESNNIPYTGYGVGTIKKHFTGNGSAKKDMMITEARRRGFDVPDDNAADAVAILSLASEAEG